MNTDAIAEQHFLSNLLRRFKRRKLLITTSFVGLSALFVLGIEVLPKSYNATSSVVIEGQTQSLVQNGNIAPETPFDDQSIGTEVAILQSRELATDTVKLTNLLDMAEFNPALRSQSLLGQALQNLRASLGVYIPQLQQQTTASLTDQALADTLDQLKKHVKVAPVPRSRVIDIVVSANNPQIAAKIANTMGDLYIRNHRDYKFAATREAHEALDSKIAELRTDADAKTQALEDYRIKHGLTVALTGTVVQEQLSALNAQLGAARSTLADAEARKSVADHSDPTNLAAVIQNPAIQRMREQEALLVADKAKLGASFNADSPYMNRINASLAAVQAQIRSEARRAVASLPNEVAAAKANVSALSARMDEVRKQASVADEARARLATLQADADAARNVYSGYLDRLRAIDASQAYGAVNVRVIQHATPPVRAAFPNQLVMIPASMVLALLSAGMLAYVTTRQIGLVGSDDIEAYFPDVPSLGLIPTRTLRTENMFSESIEVLLNRLLVTGVEPPRSVLFTSAMPSEGKTTTARAFAEAAERRGFKVLLIDADMRSTRMLKPKDRSSVPQLGLNDVLRGDIDADDALVRIEGPTWNKRARTKSTALTVLPAGSGRGLPTQLFALPRSPSVISQLSERYDLVVIDAPPALVGGDVEILSRQVAKTVMLAKWATTPVREIAEAMRRIDPPSLAGIALTMVDAKKVRRFGQRDSVVYHRALRRYHNAL